MKAFDPKYIGFHWDTGHMALHGDGMWETLMRHAGPYVAAVGWRDRGWVQDLGLKGEGGPYAGPVPRVEPLVTQPDGSAIPGTPGAGAGAGAVAADAAGRGGRGGGRAGAAGEEGAAAAGAPAGAAARGGPANSAGAGSIDDGNPLYKSLDGEMPKRPIGGKNAKGGGWSAPNVAMGTGVVHIPRVATVLAAIGFNGPSELQSEYAGIGGAETGADKIDRPRQWVIGMLKRDVDHDSQVLRDGELRVVDLTREGAAMLTRRLALRWRGRGGRRARPGARRTESRRRLAGGRRRRRRHEVLAVEPDHAGQRRDADAGVDVCRPGRPRRSSSTTSCISSAAANVVALNADTGTEAWKFALSEATPGGAIRRGMTYWPGTPPHAPRVLVTMSGGKLVQLDAKTGKLVPRASASSIS